MEKISGSSSFSRKCVVCGKKTGRYKAWAYADGIEISVPVCHKCENEMGLCLNTAMDIHLKGIRESIRHSIIITHDEKRLAEMGVELRQTLKQMGEKE